MRKEFLGTFEAAKWCRVSPGTVTRWIKEGKLPAAATAGGHRRIAVTDLIEFMRSFRMPLPPGLNGPEDFRMLIVDDEKGVREMIRWAVETEFPAIRVEEAEDGFTAGWKSRGFLPHLVILDVMMPGMNGFQVVELIRRGHEKNKPRIVVMSALASDEIEPEVKKLGADDFLQKPFEIKELQKKILSHYAQHRKDRHDAA